MFTLPPHHLPPPPHCSQDKERPEEYNGGRDSGSLAAFGAERWSAQQPPPEVCCRQGLWGEGVRVVESVSTVAEVLPPACHNHCQPPSTAATSTSNPLHLANTAFCAQVRELVDDHTWEEHCVGHAADPDLDIPEAKPKQLCLVAFLPHILDSKAAGRQAYLRVGVGVWVKGGEQLWVVAFIPGGIMGGPTTAA